MRLAIIITADPKQGDDALGRAFNALALAAEANDQRDDVSVVFAGAGTRWPVELTRLAHPAHGLYERVRSLVAGASCGCAEVFGATDGVAAAAVPELRDHLLSGTP